MRAYIGFSRGAHERTRGGMGWGGVSSLLTVVSLNEHDVKLPSEYDTKLVLSAFSETLLLVVGDG